MYGLTVRWSLADAPADVEEQLRNYVHDTSLARFTGMPGLRFKTWRMRPGEWFEGTYVFATARARDDFAADFAAKAADSPGSRIIGAPPAHQETFEVVAVAEGGEGFSAGPGPALAPSDDHEH
ncbi:hypothetical protein EF847_17945 [Actinobacteria bacterium YIM 96077]|uniref:Uncharacterized protein n=1 Tax=Phytoactinopolyspora halophila TaxID=1981511 RepID=A0A329QU66_9ACTN|nr:hypothetical protein [Phytoactinopolyspora halophila]AYY14300.1 hypothetical protein EF847_17945 [Actinobacteria bacterium YIM 96077]RAW14842.1 hypothetical protein DPM12_10160 [Phytoactinopolyspora halophila]